MADDINSGNSSNDSNMVNINNVNQGLNSVNNQISAVTNNATNQFRNLENQISSLKQQLGNMNLNPQQLNEYFNTLSSKIKEIEQLASNIKININSNPGDIQQMFNPFIEQVKILLSQSLNNVDIFQGLPQTVQNTVQQINSAFDSLDLGLEENINREISIIQGNFQNLITDIHSVQTALGALRTDLQTSNFGDFNTKLLIGDLSALEKSFKNTQSHVVDFYKAFSDINPDMAKNVFPQMFQQLKTEIPTIMAEVKKLFNDSNFVNDPKMLEQYNEYFNKINKIISEQAQSINNGFKEINPTLDPKSISYMQDVYKDFLKTIESFGELNKDTLSRLVPNSKEFEELESRTNAFKELTESVRGNRDALYEVENAEKRYNEQLENSKKYYDELDKKAKSYFENVKNGFKDFMAPLDAADKAMMALGVSGVPITIGGMKQFGAGTLDYYNKQAQWTVDATRTEAAIGAAPDLVGARSRIIDTGEALYRQTHGMIGFEEFNKGYMNLTANVGGQFGSSPQQATEDLNLINDKTFAMTKLYNITDTTTAQFVNTFYKELRVGAGETADVMSKLTQSAISSNIPVDQYIKAVSTLALSFRGVGLSGQEAVNAMDNLMTKGLTFEQAKAASQSMGGAVGGFSSKYGEVAYSGIATGQFSDPFAAIGSAIKMGWKMENGKLVQDTESYGKEMTKEIDSMINLRGIASGGGSATTMVVADYLKSLGLGKAQIAPLVTAYESGDKNLFTNTLTKEMSKGDLSTEQMQKDSLAKLTNVSESLSGMAKTMALVKDAEYKAADTLKIPLDNLYKGIGNLITTITKATDDLLKWLAPSLGDFTGGFSNTTKNIGIGTIGVVAGGLGAASLYAGAKGTRGIIEKIGGLFKGPGGTAATEAAIGAGRVGATEAGFFKSIGNALKNAPKTGGGKAAITVATLAALAYGGKKGYDYFTKDDKQKAIDASQSSDPKMYEKVSDIYEIMARGTMTAGTYAAPGTSAPGTVAMSGTGSLQHYNMTNNLSTQIPLGDQNVDSSYQGGALIPGLVATGLGAYTVLKSPKIPMSQLRVPEVGGITKKAIPGEFKLAEATAAKTTGKALFKKLLGPSIMEAFTLYDNFSDPVSHSLKGDSVKGDYTRGSINSIEGTAQAASMFNPFTFAASLGWDIGKIGFDYSAKDKSGKGGMAQLDELGGFGVGVNRWFQQDVLGNKAWSANTAFPEEIEKMRFMKSQYGVSEEKFTEYMNKDTSDPKVMERDRKQDQFYDKFLHLAQLMSDNVAKSTGMNTTTSTSGGLLGGLVKAVNQTKNITVPDNNISQLGNETNIIDNPFTRGDILNGISPMSSSSYMNNNSNSRTNYSDYAKKIAEQGGDFSSQTFGDIQSTSRTARIVSDIASGGRDKFRTDLQIRDIAASKVYDSTKDNKYTYPSGASVDASKSTQININASGSTMDDKLVKAIEKVVKELGYTNVKVEQTQKAVDKLHENATNLRFNN